MPQKFLLAVAKRKVPTYVTLPRELRLLQSLRTAGYCDVRFFPEERTAHQFAQVRGLTPLGRRVLEIVERAGCRVDDQGT